MIALMSLSPPPPPPPPPNQAPPSGAAFFAGAGTLQYAGWWQRVGAWLIDSVIGFAFFLPGVIALFAGPREINFRADGHSGPGFYEEPTAATMAIAGLLILAGVIVYVVIYSRMLGKGATIGRKAVGYRILDERTMQPIGTGRAVGRYFATILSTMPFYLGVLWPLWDAEKRTFHDMIVKTRAIKS